MVRAFGLSDIGPVRKVNEDLFVNDEALQLYLVADGMGGHAAGEVAARLATEAIVGFIRRTQDGDEHSWPYGLDPTTSYQANRLRTAVHLGNRRVFRAAESHDDYTGMGTTVVCGLIVGNRLAIANVGDSRLYRLGRGGLKQLTQDDSWTATILAHDASVDVAATLARHPMRNVLTNVLGAREQTDIHVSETDLVGGEVLLMSTDGLHGVVDDEAIGRVLGSREAPDVMARELVDLALQRGSRDNITALLVQYDETT